MMYEYYELWEIIVPAEGHLTWITRIKTRFNNYIIYDFEPHTIGFTKALLLIEKKDDDQEIKDICQFTLKHFNIEFVNVYRVSDKAIVAHKEILGW